MNESILTRSTICVKEHKITSNLGRTNTERHAIGFPVLDITEISLTYFLRRIVSFSTFGIHFFPIRLSFPLTLSLLKYADNISSLECLGRLTV